MAARTNRQLAETQRLLDGALAFALLAAPALEAIFHSPLVERQLTDNRDGVIFTTTDKLLEVTAFPATESIFVQSTSTPELNGSAHVVAGQLSVIDSWHFGYIHASAKSVKAGKGLLPNGLNLLAEPADAVPVES